MDAEFVWDDIDGALDVDGPHGSKCISVEWFS